MIGEFREDHRDLFANHRVEIGMASFPDDAMSAVEIEEIARGTVEIPSMVS